MTTVTLDDNGLEILGREECLRLLGSVPVGRIGLSSGALPVVLPVNFVLDDDRIVIRTNPGTKLDNALRDAVVAFEVDRWDGFSHRGWSVMVTGQARELTGVELDRARALPLRPWRAAPGDHYVAITTEMVSGRRIPQDTSLGPPTG
jgi:uncharacterized protein